MSQVSEEDNARNCQNHRPTATRDRNHSMHNLQLHDSGTNRRKQVKTQHAHDRCRLDLLTKGCTLDAYNQHGFEPFEIRKNSFKFQRKTRKKNLVVGVITSLLIAAQGSSPAYAATYSIDHLKLYAHSRILIYKEFQCFNQIITRESRWSYKARNGSHTGLGQMRSEYYGNLDPFRQIDSSLRYITKRYQTPCNALAFHNVKGYY